MRLAPWDMELGCVYLHNKDFGGLCCYSLMVIMTVLVFASSFEQGLGSILGRFGLELSWVFDLFHIFSSCV